ncbi:methylmalonyl-CoA mutase [Paraburkholderia sp. DGU8]|uniref:methylmalonyl-CoA mutase n=1 Tax=Paraburkholderia sp. DGU8 TaxID=3161997 RepID=UPI003467BE95
MNREDDRCGDREFADESPGAIRYSPNAVPLKALYTASDLQGVSHLGSRPGEAPFVRGPHASMYTQKPWTIRQYAGYADAADSNLAFRTALAEGAQGLSVAFDLPTHRGYDSDDPAAVADVGMAGVAIDSVEDMKRLFRQIPLDRVSVSMTMNGAVLPVLAAFIVAAQESGVQLQALTGTIQNDILKEYMVRNTWIFAPEPSLRIVADVVEYLAERAPRFNAMSISGYHFQEAGADAVLELALTLSNARTYVDALVKRGMNVERIGERLSFFFGVGTDFFVEVAKLRAARVVWAGIMSELGAREVRAQALRMHCQTSGWSLTAQQPQNNIVRTTIEAMAAVFGGTQSLHTNAYDEALALPGADASRLARDTQLIMQHEMGLCDVIDPWAGSYMMESITDDIARRVRDLMTQIATQGGVVEAIRSGWVQQRIHEAATRTQARIDGGQRVVVGVNRFRSPDADTTPGCLEVDGRRVRATQVRHLAELKAQRDDVLVSRALAALAQGARDGTGNLLALAIECIRARATIGECTGALEAVWPRYRMPSRFSSGIYGEARMVDAAWREACNRVSALTACLGRLPRVLIAKVGQDGHDRGAKIVAAALADAGFHVSLGALFRSPAEVVDDAIAANADVVGISSLSGAHLDLVAEVVRRLRVRRPTVAVVVGGIIPDEHARLLRRNGIFAVLGPGTPMESIVASFVETVERALASASVVAD